MFVDDLEVPQLSRRDLYELRSQIGYVFQFAALFDSLTHRRECRDGTAQAGRCSTPPSIRARVAEALDLVDLPNVEDQFPAELSGGMRKRVGIARAIALRPKYLLYDEPTTGLDPVTSAVIDELMIRMREKLGVTSIVITHDMRSAYRVGTRIAMLYEGKVRQVGTVDEIRLSDDPVVRQFVEGRAEIDLGARRLGWRRNKARLETSAGGVVMHAEGDEPRYLLIRDSYRQLGISQGPPRERRAARGRRAPRGAGGDGPRPRAAPRRPSTPSTGTSGSAGA